MIAKKKIFSFINTFQILSIDVVIGTIAVGFMATKLLNITPNPYWWLILPLTVWVIYTLDHIIDSYKNKTKAVIARHRFHYIYQKSIIISITIASALSISLSLIFLDNQIIYYGLLLSLFIAIYLIIVFLVKKKKTILLQKELIIAFVYTSGIFLAPLVWYQKMPPYPILLVIFNIFILVWLEGIIISWFDYDDDIKDGHTSFTIVVGKKNTRRFIIVMQVLLAILTKISMLTVTTKIEFAALIITIIMDIILLIVVFNPNKFYKNEYYRITGEAIFLLPLLIILV